MKNRITFDYSYFVLSTSSKRIYICPACNHQSGSHIVKVRRRQYTPGYYGCCVNNSPPRFYNLCNCTYFGDAYNVYAT